MKTDLTSEQIQAYREDGVLHVPAFLNADEVQQLKAAVLDAVNVLGDKKLIGSDMRQSDDYYGQVFTQKLNLWMINDTVRSFMLSPKLGQMLCRLEGVKGMRVWHDQTLIKEPFGNPTAWHLDNPYWSFDSRHAISIWIALEDATPWNGCMCFLPGSHKLADFKTPGIGPNMRELFKTYPEMARIPTRPVPMKAGDCSFHNGLTAHGAGANMTHGRRIAMTCAYMPEGSTFNGKQNILPRDYFNSLTIGDVLENDQWNPLVGRLEDPIDESLALSGKA